MYVVDEEDVVKEKMKEKNNMKEKKEDREMHKRQWFISF